MIVGRIHNKTKRSRAQFHSDSSHQRIRRLNAITHVIIVSLVQLRSATQLSLPHRRVHNAPPRPLRGGILNVGSVCVRASYRLQCRGINFSEVLILVPLRLPSHLFTSVNQSAESFSHAFGRTAARLALFRLFPMLTFLASPFL